jgi:hypothetical protein
MFRRYGLHPCLLALASFLAYSIPIVATAEQNDRLNAQSPLLFRWTEFTADGKREERSIYTAQITSCPIGTSERLSPQWGTGDFKIRVCSQTLETNLLSIDRIVVIGDTGCRFPAGQNCDRVDVDWPLKKIASLAAGRKPDLVIHVGDYLYRECPNGELLCGDPNEGNRWNAWQLDFFQQVRDLLVVAPWIFVRGNHERCGRQSEGWARLISPGPENSLDCVETAAPYLLEFRDINFVIVDSSAAGNANPLKGQTKLRDILTRVERNPVWLLTHKPLHMLNEWLPNNTKVDLVLSGHVHGFITYSLGPVMQLVVGNGGTNLDLDLPGFDAETNGTSTTTVGKHGYFLIERQIDRWLGTLYGTDDKVLETCVIQSSKTQCNTN